METIFLLNLIFLIPQNFCGFKRQVPGHTFNLFRIPLLVAVIFFLSSNLWATATEGQEKDWSEID